MAKHLNVAMMRLYWEVLTKGRSVQRVLAKLLELVNKMDAGREPEARRSHKAHLPLPKASLQL